MPLDKRIAEIAAEALRSVTRVKCDDCSNFIRPTLVDAVVMALANDGAQTGDAIVYTQDVNDMGALQAFFPRVQVERA